MRACARTSCDAAQCRIATPTEMEEEKETGTEAREAQLPPKNGPSTKITAATKPECGPPRRPREKKMYHHTETRRER
jgi:hypothetical protein